MASRGPDSAPSRPPNVATSVGWQLGDDEKARGCAAGSAKPCRGFTPAQRIAREERTERGEVAPLCRAINHDDRRDHVARLPAHLPREEGNDSGLDVQAAEQLLGIYEHGLDFDDEQNALDRVVGEKIDPPTIAVPIEAHLASHAPPVLLQAM